MGCDIHLFAEIKKDVIWEKVDKVFENPYYDPKEDSRVDDEGFEWNAKFIDEPYRHRNYFLFGILANVRNGIGFGGCDLGNGFNSIAEPKGLPEDVTPELSQKSDDWGCDGHSHSFFTVAELLAYNWNQSSILRGIVGLEDYKIFKEKGCPESYCGGVSGGSVKHVSNDEMDILLRVGYNALFKNANEAKLTWGLLSSFYTKVSWTETYAKCADIFLTETIPRLKKLGDPKNVRIVFWFDN